MSRWAPRISRALPLNNLGAGAAPTVKDDSSLGYAPGSLWVWLSATPNDASIGYGTWICTDATPGAAVWRRIEANNNLAAAANPIVTDDAVSGYAVGSLWIWPGNSIWVCSDPTTGAAVWVQALASAAATQLIETGFNTAAMAAGDLGYLSAANVVSKAIATSLATARVIGAYEGSAGQMTRGGTIELQRIEAIPVALVVLATQRLYLSATDAGAVTNVRPNGATQVVVSVGYARTNGTGAGGTVPMLLELEDTDVPLNNLAGAVPPTVNDDSTAGYTIGSRWIGPVNDVWVCTDATAGAAVWASLAEPAANVQAAGYAIAARDIGNVIFANGAGAQAFTLPNLSTAIGSVGDVTHPQAGRMAILTIQQVNAATLVTITPGASSQINGAGVGVPYALAVGRSRASLFSYDGLNWISSDANGMTVWGNATIPITTNFNFADYPNGAVLLINTAIVGAISGQLPTPVRGLLYTVKDIQGNLSTNAFTVVRAVAEKIEGVAASYIFGVDYGALTLACDGTDWWIL